MFLVGTAMVSQSSFKKVEQMLGTKFNRATEKIVELLPQDGG